MCPFASNAIGLHPAPLFVQPYSKSFRRTPSEPSFFAPGPKRALLRVFPPSGTLYHFMSQPCSAWSLKLQNRRALWLVPKRAWRARAAVHWERHAPLGLRRPCPSELVTAARWTAPARSAAVQSIAAPGCPSSKAPQRRVPSSKGTSGARIAASLSSLAASAFPHAGHGATHAWPPMS